MTIPSSKHVWYSSLAAGAAVVPPAQGAIRFTDVSPDLTASTVTWDLDNGGTPDFRLEVTVVSGQEKSNLLHVAGGDGTGIAQFSGHVDGADRMLAGETIGTSTTFGAFRVDKTLFDEADPPKFDWRVGDRGFVGLRVNLNGSDHYGWADVSINPVGTTTFDHTLYSYAYNDVADADIMAGAIPEPSTAALLVAGAAGAAALRRRRE